MKDLESFIDGLPQRYLRSYGTEQVLKHLELASRLWQQGVQLVLAPHRNLYELTVVTRDKPYLFATLAGALSAWGMEIVKANAFSNSDATVIDCFYFKDRFRTLDLNPSEHERIKKDISEVVRGDRSLEHLIRARSGFKSTNRARVKIEEGGCGAGSQAAERQGPANGGRTRPPQLPRGESRLDVRLTEASPHNRHGVPPMRSSVQNE